jgi:hypothetical protein
VGDDEDGFGGHGFLGPELEEFGAEVLGGQDVEGAEGLVHEEDFWLDDEGAGESYALAHAAGELFGEGCLETVETDGVEHLEAAFAALFWIDASGLQGGFYVLEDGEPGEESEGLEDDGNVDLGLGDGLFVPIDLAGGGFGEACEHSEHGRFAGAAGAEEGEDFAGDDGEIGGADDLDAVLAGLGVVLLDGLGADDRLGSGQACGLSCGVRRGGGFLHGRFSRVYVRLDGQKANFSPLLNYQIRFSLVLAGCSFMNGCICGAKSRGVDFRKLSLGHGRNCFCALHLWRVGVNFRFRVWPISCHSVSFFYRILRIPMGPVRVPTCGSVVLRRRVFPTG